MADNPFVAQETTAATSPDCVYHFFVDDKGEETGENEKICLAPDGSADLSTMKDQRRAETWKEYGVRDLHGFFRVFPNEGKKFLEVLLTMNNQNWRFRQAV